MSICIIKQRQVHKMLLLNTKSEPNVLLYKGSDKSCLIYLLKLFYQSFFMLLDLLSN